MKRSKVSVEITLSNLLAVTGEYARRNEVAIFLYNDNSL